MNKSIWLPISISLIFICIGAIMAFTNLFHPIIVFIHSKNISLLQAGACILGSVIGFYFVFHLLVRLGTSFLPEDWKDTRNVNWNERWQDNRPLITATQFLNLGKQQVSRDKCSGDRLSSCFFNKNSTCMALTQISHELFYFKQKNTVIFDSHF